MFDPRFRHIRTKRKHEHYCFGGNELQYTHTHTRTYGAVNYTTTVVVSYINVIVATLQNETKCIRLSIRLLSVRANV